MPVAFSQGIVIIKEISNLNVSKQTLSDFKLIGNVEIPSLMFFIRVDIHI